MSGNHDSAAINKLYGFLDECKRRYDIKLWKMLTDLFNCLLVHGGISPELKNID